MNDERSTRDSGLLLFRLRSFERSLFFFVSAALVMAAVTHMALRISPALTERVGLRLAEALLVWKIEELSPLPEWGRYMVNNGLAVLVMMLVGPLGCAAEAGLRKRSGLYDALGRATGRPNTLLRFLHRDLARLTSAQARDSVAIALLVPPLAMAFNGAMMGMVCILLTSQSGQMWAELVVKTLPHGAVELTALALAGSVGLEHADRLLEAALSGADLVRAAMERIRTRAVVVSALVVLVLIALAGYIEAEVTMKIYNWVFLPS